MLFRNHILRGIERGEITLAFRRWQRPSVRSGGTLNTTIGVVRVGTVKRVVESSITGREARAAGYESINDLREELDRRSIGNVYRIEVGYAGEDPRIALRNQDRLTALDLAEIEKRLDRLDRASRHGRWTAATLGVIRAEPGVRAADLAPRVGQEKDKFKLNVRKLKNLGLTESLETGYRLSPRGQRVIDALDHE